MNDIDGIYISINPTSMQKIIQGTKQYEYRNYIPKKDFKYLYVYVTAPIAKIKYLIEIGNIVQYPQKLNGYSDGVFDFNMGTKAKYAYSICKVFELLSPLSIEELRETYSFIPPQAFAYDTTFSKLSRHIKNSKKALIKNGNYIN